MTTPAELRNWARTNCPSLTFIDELDALAAAWESDIKERSEELSRNAWNARLALAQPQEKPVAWFKHGPYDNDGAPLMCVFEDPHDDDFYSPLYYHEKPKQPQEIESPRQGAGLSSPASQKVSDPAVGDPAEWQEVPTPRTDDPETGYRAHFAEHEHNRKLCRALERELAAAPQRPRRTIRKTQILCILEAAYATVPQPDKTAGEVVAELLLSELDIGVTND